MSGDHPMAGKASFDDIYDRPDPRAYFRTLSALDYQTPEHARGVFSFLARTLRDRKGGERFSVVDLCCSYGINAALLNHDLTLGDLYARYRASELDDLSSDDLVAADRKFYGRRRRPDALPVVGLDAAANAIDYAVRVGILDAGTGENLEESDPSDELERHLAATGLVTVTGGIGYITETTFDRVLGAAVSDQLPWVAAFSLRWVDMAPIAALLEHYGLTLELLGSRTFRQRRFVDDDEREYALGELRRLGIDPEGSETDGYHHVCLYLARPRTEAEVMPVDELLAPVL